MNSMKTPRDARVRVLVLGGWSPGPLAHLREQFAESCVFVEPALHMPPHGVRWCCTWEFLLLAVAAFSALKALALPGWWKLALSLPALAILPILVRLLVRGSIRRSVAAATAAHVEHVEVVVGFSWGGGVACWLLANGASEEEEDGGRSLGAAQEWLLLAPTLDAMASAAGLPPRSRPDVRLGIERATFALLDDEDEGRDSDGAGPGAATSCNVHIIHAANDPFCPDAQLRALQATRASMHVCRDAHTLDSPWTLDEVARVFAGLLELARRRRTW